jgi:hypothetical protein
VEGHRANGLDRTNDFLHTITISVSLLYHRRDTKTDPSLLNYYKIQLPSYEKTMKFFESIHYTTGRPTFTGRNALYGPTTWATSDEGTGG